jgi:hypothetical protein
VQQQYCVTAAHFIQRAHKILKFKGQFIYLFGFFLLIFISELIHTYPSLPHEVSDNPKQAAHYHTLGPKLGASFLTWHVAGLRVKAAKLFLSSTNDICLLLI